MKKYILSLIKNWLPPIISKKLKKFFKKRATYFTGDYKSWKEAKANAKGYQDNEILKKILASTLKVKNGDYEYERDGILFEKIEYSWQILTGIMWVAAKNNGNLCVLDLGGSLGTTFFQNKRFLRDINLSNWNIVEQSNFVKKGKIHIEDSNIRFFDSIEECLKKCSPNVIIISSSLQYMPDPYATIKSLIKIGADAIIFDRTITNNLNSNKIYVQHASPNIGGSYPCYTISESWLKNSLQKTYELIDSFDSLDFYELNEIKSAFKGFIFFRKNLNYQSKTS